MIWWCILALLLIFIAIVLVRTLRFTPASQQPPAPQPVSVDGPRAVSHLAAMIRCKTVSNRDHSQEDAQEFRNFRALLPELYPHIHQTCEREHIGLHGLLYLARAKQRKAHSTDGALRCCARRRRSCLGTAAL